METGLKQGRKSNCHARDSESYAWVHGEDRLRGSGVELEIAEYGNVEIGSATMQLRKRCEKPEGV